MDRLDAMAMLVEVAGAGSLSAAGRRLGVPLATVSRKIADLEAHLGTRLLIRSARRVTPTQAGEAYLAACRRILGAVQEAERAAAGEYHAAKGELVLTAPLVFGRLHVLPVVTAFLAAYPAIDVRLLLADRVLHLLDDHVDLAVRIGALPDSSFVSTRLGAVRRVVCASPDYLARRGRPALPGDLAAHDCVTFEGLPQAWTFGRGRSEIAVAVHSRLVVNTAEAAVDAAVAGVGVARVVSYQAIPALEAGRVALVLRDFEPPSQPVSLVHPGQGPLPLKVRAFLDFAAPRLRAIFSSGAVSAGVPDDRPWADTPRTEGQRT
jgi:DNA-binding transcriptional LysR family regulator